MFQTKGGLSSPTSLGYKLSIFHDFNQHRARSRPNCESRRSPGGPFLADRRRRPRFSHGAGRRRDAAYRIRPLDHPMEAGHRRRSAAERSGVAGRVRPLQTDPAIRPAQCGHDARTASRAIFWWEWAHRLLARIVGAAFILPGLMVLVARPAQGRARRQVAVATGLLALEPIVGWWMVTSGLSERTEVAQERLALHLLIAAATFGALIYAAVGLERAADGEDGAARLRAFRRGSSPRSSSANSASARWSRACAPDSSTTPGR